ncbi:MAG: DegT/DnrJ/EryC1/StrS family aminotransferase [Thermoproteota archaeon]
MKELPSRRDIGSEETKELIDIIRTGNLTRVGGTKVLAFEKEFAKLYRAKHGFASTSGTTSIHVALGAINPEPLLRDLNWPYKRHMGHSPNTLAKLHPRLHRHRPGDL